MKKKGIVINPYLATLSVPVLSCTRKDAWIINADGTKERVTYLVDRSPYYRGFIAKTNNDVYEQMSPQAHKLYNYIQNHAPIRNAHLFISPTKYMLYAKIKSDNTFRAIIRELVQLNVLQRYEGRRNRYWYNPNFFNRGNRLTKYPSNLDSSL